MAETLVLLVEYNRKLENGGERTLGRDSGSGGGHSKNNETEGRQFQNILEKVAEQWTIDVIYSVGSVLIFSAWQTNYQPSSARSHSIHLLQSNLTTNYYQPNKTHHVFQSSPVCFRLVNLYSMFLEYCKVLSEGDGAIAILVHLNNFAS